MFSYFINLLLKSAVLKGQNRHHLQFKCAKTPLELQRILDFRLAEYQKQLPYMLETLDEHGQDNYDASAYHFYVQDGERILAVVRFNRYPFESMQWIEPQKFSPHIGLQQLDQTLEISRLITAQQHGYKRLMPSLLLFSSLYLWRYTNYRYYMAYCKESNKDKFKGFRAMQTELSFSIQCRGEHAYSFYFGEIKQALLQGGKTAFRMNKLKKTTLARG